MENYQHQHRRTKTNKDSIKSVSDHFYNGRIADSHLVRIAIIWSSTTQFLQRVAAMLKKFNLIWLEAGKKITSIDVRATSIAIGVILTSHFFSSMFGTFFPSIILFSQCSVKYICTTLDVCLTFEIIEVEVPYSIGCFCCLFVFQYIKHWFFDQYLWLCKLKSLHWNVTFDYLFINVKWKVHICPNLY